MTTNENITTAASGSTEPGVMSLAATTDGAILAALEKLDPNNDEHWTNDGKPAMDALNALLPAPTTRKHLDEIAPDFKREPGQSPIGGDPNIYTAPAPDEEHLFSEEQMAKSPEERLSAVERDLAFLRSVYGWPTKDA